MTSETQQTVYWLWVQRAFGCGAGIADALRYFGDPKTLWQAGENDYRASECFGKLRSFSQKRLPLLLNKSLDDCRETLALCRKQRITVLTPDDPRYPQRLLPLRDLPAALYIRGDADCLNPATAFAVIGARVPTQYAKDAATQISGVFARENCTVVSGGALGVDSLAHMSALSAGKPTLLVMGCGHGANYLPSNAKLRRQVSQCGALITEYPPLTEPFSGSFPLRNRLISGLSDAVIIVQAGENSGTLNTARHATKQGKTLFVLPGSRDSAAFAGSNRLLQENALVVQQGEDVLRRYGFAVQAKAQLHNANVEPFSALRLEEQQQSGGQSRKASAAGPKMKVQPPAEPNEKKYTFAPESVSKTAQIVYNILQTQPMGLDDTVRRSALPVPQVLSALTELEIAGAVSRDETAVYRCL